MGRSSLSSLARELVAAAILLVVSKAMAQSMLLAVPHRGAGATQTAATALEFDATSIASSAAISVSGTAAPVPATVYTSGCDPSTCLGTGDSAGTKVEVRRLSSSRARVDLVYEGDFGSAGGAPDWCAYTGPSAARNHLIDLLGFTGASGFRITSYMAPSSAACNQRYLRVSGVGKPSISGTALPRLGQVPQTIVLVLDKSPSMQWNVPSSTDIRWDRLKSSVLLFTSLWDSIGSAPPPNQDGHEDDQLGIVFFGGTASPHNLDGVNVFKRRGNNPAPWSAAASAALADSFIGGTSIGAGVVGARVPLALVPGDKTLVLFTDGEQNTPPCITREGETLSPTLKPYPGLPGATYLDQCTVTASGAAAAKLMLGGSVLAGFAAPTFTIGLGEGGTAAAALLLNEISDETAGRSRFANDGLAMDIGFVSDLVNALKGGTATLLERRSATLPNGVKSADPVAVKIDPSLTRLSFALSWEDQTTQRGVGLTLTKADGTTLTPDLLANGPGFQVVTVNLPRGDQATTLAATVQRGGAAANLLRYQLSVIGVESRLSLRAYETARQGTAGAIQIVAEVGWDKAGLENLPPGAVKAIIERPPENLGTILHDTTQYRSTQIGADRSPLAVKFDALVRDVQLLTRIEPRKLPDAIALVHAGGGRYAGQFNETVVGGNYRIRVVYDWKDARTGEIHRIEDLERQVQVMPTARHSIVKVGRGPENNEALITVELRDRHGNHVGPGFESRMSAQTDIGKLALPFSDPDLTGGYRVRLSGLSPGADPRVKIDYAGQSIRDARLSQLESGGGAGIGRYAVWLGLGRAWPRGSLSRDHDPGFGGSLGVEYALTPAASVEASLGDFRLPRSSNTNAFDVRVSQLGVAGKWYLSSTPWRWFVSAGVGRYDIRPGSTHSGTKAGFGLQHALGPSGLSLEGRFAAHRVAVPSDSLTFSSLQLALRYEF